MTRMTRIKWIAFRALGALALASVPAFANPILVNNFDFETLPTGGLNNVCAGPSCFFFRAGQAVPGWQITGLAGQIEPSPLVGSAYYTSRTGLTQGYSNGGMLSQTVSETVTAGVQYTLMVDLGWRLDTAFGAIADLRIGTGATSTAVFVTGLTPVQGTFSTFKATYTGTIADVGKSLTIELSSLGPQGNFDNILLSETPEPFSFLLMGSALLVLTGLGRRRLKS